MRTVVGIICEYDPFHNGHRKQIYMIRLHFPKAVILCVMSGCFTQRGMPSLFSPMFRAKVALEAGADLVLELPCAFSVREADQFALGGLEILNRLGFVTHISFGCEDDLKCLLPIAKELEYPSEDFSNILREQLATGLPYPSAQEIALQSFFSHTECMRKPNNILAISYLRALMRTRSKIQPYPVLREGDYHNDQLNDYDCPSASAIRKAFLSGKIHDAEMGCGYSLAGQNCMTPEALDSLLIWKLRSSTVSDLAGLPNCTEGLEYRLHEMANQVCIREELLSKLKTKRYPYARLSRLCTHALLDVTEELLKRHPSPEYVRILGLRPGSWTDFLKKSKIPILAKATDGDFENELFRLDQRAWELWALGAKLPAGFFFREKIAVLNSK